MFGPIWQWGGRQRKLELNIALADGNGRATRFLADLVFAAAQDPTEQQYGWDLDKPHYIGLLRAYDVHRDVADLAAFVDVEPIESSGA